MYVYLCVRINLYNNNSTIFKLHELMPREQAKKILICDCPWSLGLSQKPGTLGLWQRTRSLGQSRDFRVVPEARDCPGVLDRPKSLGQSQTLVQSQKPRTVLRFWDCPKDLESQHHSVYFSISEKSLGQSVTLVLSQKTGTVLGSRDSPKDLQSPNTMGVYFSISET